MKKTILHAIVPIVAIFAFLLNFNIVSKNNSSYLKLTSIQPVFAQDQGDDSGACGGSGESGNESESGKCWTSSETPCPPSTTTTTSSGSGDSGVTTVTTTRAKTTCAAGGEDSCQERDCDGATVGDVHVCSK
jgi:hypothetical protein